MKDEFKNYASMFGVKCVFMIKKSVQKTRK